MKKAKKIVICRREGSLHLNFQCLHRLERANEWTCKKCVEEGDQTEKEWSSQMRTER